MTATAAVSTDEDEEPLAPPPAQPPPKKVGRWAALMSPLEVGGSFAARRIEEHRLRVAAATYGRRTGRRYEVRILDEKRIGCWRVA